MHLSLIVIELCQLLVNGQISQSYSDYLGYGETNPASLQLELFRENNSNILNYTLSSGAVVSDVINVLTVGPRGPMLLQDLTYLDEFQHFDRERIPERVVHAKGAGAMGYFILINDMSAYTSASIFTEVGRQTPVTVRFSQVIGETGSADTIRDARGFAIKFYTDAGNWDLVGLNLPVFWVRDPLLFPSFIHAAKRNPVTHLFDYNMFWDFVSLMPETVFMTMFVYSDYGIPANYRMMNGFGPNTFILTTSGGFVFCKFNFVPNQGVDFMDPATAQQIAGIDPDFYLRDLYNNIARGNYPSWNMSIQIMTVEQAQNLSWNPFDITKLWPTNLFPLQLAGILVLNENPSNYFKQIEQVGFAPSRLVPGIQASPDKILQGRLFPYEDTQLYRIGPNHELLEINRPLVTVANRERDGLDRYGSNQGGEPNYFPNSFNGPQPFRSGQTPSIPLSGDAARYNSADDDNFSQAQYYWSQVFSPEQRERLVQNIVSTLGLTAPFIQERAINNFNQVGEDFGAMLREALGLNSSSSNQSS